MLCSSRLKGSGTGGVDGGGGGRVGGGIGGAWQWWLVELLQ